MRAGSHDDELYIFDFLDMNNIFSNSQEGIDSLLAPDRSQIDDQIFEVSFPSRIGRHSYYFIQSWAVSHNKYFLLLFLSPTHGNPFITFISRYYDIRCSKTELLHQN